MKSFVLILYASLQIKSVLFKKKFILRFLIGKRGEKNKHFCKTNSFVVFGKTKQQKKKRCSSGQGKINEMFTRQMHVHLSVELHEGWVSENILAEAFGSWLVPLPPVVMATALGAAASTGIKSGVYVLYFSSRLSLSPPPPPRHTWNIKFPPRNRARLLYQQQRGSRTEGRVGVRQ